VKTLSGIPLQGTKGQRPKRQKKTKKVTKNKKTWLWGIWTKGTTKASPPNHRTLTMQKEHFLFIDNYCEAVLRRVEQQEG